MRIRKHAKISPLLNATSSLKPATVTQPHVCQLNQSPWDAMTFSPPSSSPPPPPPPCQTSRSGIGAGNGSSSGDISGDREFISRRRSDATSHTIETEEAAPLVKHEQTTLCTKTDGKSWQCRREAAEGNSLCDHHISLAKSYSSSVGHHAGKKSAKLQAAAAADLPRRARAKKAPASALSNPYEFYYYSGFGPRWGKQRGESRKNSSMPENVGGDDNNDNDDASGVAEAVPISNNIDEFDYEEYEDEDDDDDDDSRDNGRKRVRKPIKARSLKSLL